MKQFEGGHNETYSEGCMKIITTLINGDVAGDFQNIIERRADFALKRFRHNIQRIHVRFEGVNGLKGEAGVQCSVLLNFISYGVIVVQGGSLDVFSAFNICINKIAEVIKIKKMTESCEVYVIE